MHSINLLLSLSLCLITEWHGSQPSPCVNSSSHARHLEPWADCDDPSRHDACARIPSKQLHPCRDTPNDITGHDDGDDTRPHATRPTGPGTFASSPLTTS